jgi:preprotein translocase subunit YajC
VAVDQTLASLTLGAVDGGGVIRIGGTAASKTAVTMRFATVADTSVVCGMPIGSLTATAWHDAEGTPDTITAPRLGTLSINGDTKTKAPGDFEAGLLLTGEGVLATAKVLTTATVKGAVAPGVWDVRGAVGAVNLSGAVGLAVQPWELKGVTALGSLTLGDVADAVVTVSGNAGAVRAIRWQDGSLTAAAVTSITTTGDFEADLTLSGVGVAAKAKTLGAATVKGAVTSGTWDVTGATGAITICGAVGGAGAPWVLTSATTVASLTLGDVADAVVTLSGNAGAVRAIRWQDGSLTAAAVTSITTTGVAATTTVTGISGDFGADVTLSYTGTKSALASLTVAGWLTGATISSAGAVGTVSLGGIRDSTLSAGNLAGAYSKITSLTVKGIKTAPTASFVNSKISAWTLGTVSVKGVETVNGQAVFGIQGHTITSYTRDGKKYASKGLPGLVIDQADDYTAELV